MRRVHFVRTPYNYDVDEASVLSGLLCAEETLAQQQFKDECDINTIIRRFGLGYKIPESYRAPVYGDFTGLDSYHEAANAIVAAGESFDLLPASLRERFANDPGKFVDFVLDESNRDEAITLGLLPKPQEAPSGASGSTIESSVIPTGSP